MDTSTTTWPKIIPPLTEEQRRISDDFMKYWHEVLPRRFGVLEKFNHRYPVRHAPSTFRKTLEIGAGLGEHLEYETLSPQQKANYVALELRPHMAARIQERHPEVSVTVGDCQQRLPYEDAYFDRILAIHVLEHLPNLPATVRELRRLCHPEMGILSVVIPCEGGAMYSLARQVSAKRLFEKRYGQSYDWFIRREHLNRPVEIVRELERCFRVVHTGWFPFLIPSRHLNLCIGLTLRPLPHFVSTE